LSPKDIEIIKKMYNIDPEDFLHDRLVETKYPGSLHGMRPEED